jgi:hypothetical protein
MHRDGSFNIILVHRSATSSVADYLAATDRFLRGLHRLIGSRPELQRVFITAHGRPGEMLYRDKPVIKPHRGGRFRYRHEKGKRCHSPMIPVRELAGGVSSALGPERSITQPVLRSPDRWESNIRNLARWTVRVISAFL